MSNPSKSLPMFVSTSAFNELPNLTQDEKAELQSSLNYLALYGSVPNEIPQIIDGQGYRMAKAGDVTFVFRRLTVDEVAQQKGSPSDTEGFILLDLFIEDADLKRREHRSKGR